MSRLLGETTQHPAEVLPNLGDVPYEEQRTRLLLDFGSRGLLEPSDPRFNTANALADIIAAKYEGLSGYVKEVEPRMRQGAVIRIRSDDETVKPAEIFERIMGVDGVKRSTLLTRSISRARVEDAMRTGSDRDGSSNTGYHGGEYEALAMKEYAVLTPADTTYVSLTKPTSDDITISKHGATLVYAAEALQDISPKSRRIMGSSGYHAFIDPRLKWQALLAVVESAEPSPYHAQPTIGRAALSHGLLLEDVSF